MPEVPAVPGIAGLKTCAASPVAGLRTAATLSELVEAVFAPDGALARTIPGFEARSGQTEMAAAVARRFEDGGVLLAEAGTGTGKTLAYLIPAILSRQRVLVSTGTKNLQEQIYFKDIPALRDTLGVPFTATCMKGRANYLCLHRLDQLDAGPSLDPAMNVFLPIIREWSARTETGDRAELAGLPEDVPVWNDVSATAETCLGTECPRYDDCFVTRMRQRAAASDVVIVNHHLLCADAAVRQSAFGEVIPACANAIVDEAHQLEDVATQYFGYSVSNYRLEELARDVERLTAAGLLADERAKDDIAKAIACLRDSARAFFTELAFAHRSSDRLRSEERVRASASSLAQTSDSAADLTGALDVLEGALAGAGSIRLTALAKASALKKADPTKADPTRDESEDASREAVATLVRRTGELRDEIRLLLRAGDSDYVYFVEFRGRGIFLRAAPVDVSAIVRELLLDRMRTTVLTSATLTVDGTFEYIRKRLGIKNAAEICLPSEFDFARQALMYLPPRMPDPRSPDFSIAAGREVVEILKRTRGRAFVLFTSYATMREVLGIAEMALDYPIFAQGSAPRTQLLTQFRETPHAVLFATSSFWQGVDVVGEALSCVIIDKLPFASPGDPVTAARIEAIRERGGDPFGEYQVPLAILALQQGLGRLIRHRQDRGLLAVLDPRLRTKGYGRRFIASLPPAPVVQSLTSIEAFFCPKPME
ncbi:MAG TPA: ATP-dependent DNA helicase [Vicinamibacterales bacterium]